jgi:predicted RNA binding protein with dsRBD fold (UPF0201 family)
LNGQVQIIVKAKVFPTENTSSVERCIKNIFPDAKLEARDGWVEGTSVSYDRFVELLAQQRIRDAARDHIMHFRRDGTARFYLNKQAAFAGKINLCGPSDGSLGPVEVNMTLKDWDAFLRLVSPPVIRSKLVEIGPEDEGDEDARS